MTARKRPGRGWLAILAAAVLLGGCGAEGRAERDLPALLQLTPEFADEFGGDALDPRWRTDFRVNEPPPGTIARRTLYTNRERQVYVEPAYLGLGITPHRIADGVLTLIARPLTPAQRGAMLGELSTLPPEQQDSAMRDVAYSSGMISSRGAFAQRFGYFEMRARWTGGKGIWPAFWLLPDNGGWPPEIDIMEAHGDKPDDAFQTVHSKVAPKAGDRVRVPGGTGMWHRYGALWTPSGIRFYIDGRETSRQIAPADATGPMYMIANLAVGGYWPGDPDADTPFPARMQIDWVRAYALPGGWTEDRLSALDE